MQNSSVTLTVVGQNDNSAIYIAFLNLVNLRDLFGVETKLKKYIQEQQPNQLLQPEHEFCQQN